MAFSSSILTLFLSLVLFIKRFPLQVNGNAALVRQVCRETSSSQYCQTCFASYEHSSHDDIKGLALTTIVGCARDEYNRSQKLLKAYEGRYPAEVRNCISEYQVIDGIMAEALASIFRQLYADVRNKVNEAATHLHQCEARFGKAPADLQNSFVIFDASLKNVIDVMSEIH